MIDIRREGKRTREGESKEKGRGGGSKGGNQVALLFTKPQSWQTGLKGNWHPSIFKTTLRLFHSLLPSISVI